MRGFAMASHLARGTWSGLVALATGVVTACAPSSVQSPPASANGAGAEARAVLSAPGSSSGVAEPVAPGGATSVESARPANEGAVAETAPEPPAPAVAGGTFPPVRVALPTNAAPAEGDGEWLPFGNAALGERAATAPFIVRTVLHPLRGSRFLTVTIAAVDLSRVNVRLVPGTEDMLWAKRPPGEPSGVVPAPEQERLLAVMNGGFQPKHGRWGLVAGPVVITPPRDEGCTLALLRDGTVRLAPWPKLAAAQDRIESLRQTPPCLLEDGAVHPALLRNDDKRWAGHAADLQTRRRSAVGLDASGRVLFYAIGEEAAPRWLAEALRLAGARSAAELDINWYWTRFLVFGKPSGDPLQVTSTLIPKMEHLKRGYVERPSTRDFFYFVERQ